MGKLCLQNTRLPPDKLAEICHFFRRQNLVQKVISGLLRDVLSSGQIGKLFGVLSFAPGETITPDMEQNIMDQFEALAFAGLDRDQYAILWVRHEHAGHHELHFLTPRVELSSGKSLNIRPPGKATQKQFDDLRSAINAQYGLADPDDPTRARNVAIPDHELKQAAEAMRAGQPPPENIRNLIDTVFTQRAIHGLIRNRKELLDHAKSLGFIIPRAGKDSITLQDPNSSKRWRFKGPLYAANYEPSRLLEASSRTGQQPLSEANPEAAHRFQERVAKHMRQRARYHRERYQKTSQKPPEHLFSVQDRNTYPDRLGPLSGDQGGDDPIKVNGCLLLIMPVSYVGMIEVISH